MLTVLTLTLIMTTLTRANPVVTTHGKLTHLSTAPCDPDLWDTVVTNSEYPDDTHTRSSLTPLDEQLSLIHLKAVTSEVKDILSLLINDTLVHKWLCKDFITDRIRQRYNFRWTLDSLDGVDDEKADRLKSLVEVSAYVIYIRSTLQMDESDQIYGDSRVILQDLKHKLRETACILRDLIPDVDDNIIETNVKKGKKSTGQTIFENLGPGTTQQIYRYLTCGAIHDMHDSFSHQDTYLGNPPAYVASD